MLRTNFDKKDLEKYEDAIREFKATTGSDRLSIHNEAYDCNGLLMPDAMSLHDKEMQTDVNLKEFEENNKALQIFWNVFDNSDIITKTAMHLNMQFYMEYCMANEYVTPQNWIKNHKHF